MAEDAHGRVGGEHATEVLRTPSRFVVPRLLQLLDAVVLGVGDEQVAVAVDVTCGDPRVRSPEGDRRTCGLVESSGAVPEKDRNGPAELTGDRLIEEAAMAAADEAMKGSAAAAAELKASQAGQGARQRKDTTRVAQGAANTSGT